MNDLFAAECGGDNPMTQMVNHMTRKDGVAQPIPGMMGDPRTAAGQPGQMGPLGPLGAQSGGEFFRDDGGALANDLARLRMQQGQAIMARPDAAGPRVMGPGGVARGDGWASDFASSGSAMGGPVEMAAMEQAFGMARARPAAGWASEFNPGVTGAAMGPMGAAMGPMGPMGPMGQMGPIGGMMPPMMPQQRTASDASWKQAQSQPHNWANEFLQYDETVAAAPPAQMSAEQRELQRTASELISQASDPKFKDSQFMNFVGKIGAGEVVLEGNKLVENGQPAATATATATATTAATTARAGNWADEFVTDEVKAGRINPATMAEGWAKQFYDNPELAEQYFEGPDAFEEMQSAWNEVHKNHDTPNWDQSQQVHESGYSFNPENPFLAENLPYDEALKNARDALHGGALAAAILWCEAAVQHEPARADGWELLGLNQAENEQETPAILALRECVRLEPARSSAHLALSVSYTNELRFSDTYNSLEAALLSNPKYAGVEVPEVAAPPTDAMRYLPMADRHAKIQQMFIGAAQLSPTAVDPDVQVGLGVLFNISNEYDKAVDCFEAALQGRPDDSSLWNKLGATLANGNRSEEAVDAYHSALQIRPGYIRARYNLGISCINLKSYKDASEHFLGALKLQQLASEDSSRRNMSDTIWSSLRMSLLMAGGLDQLAARTRERDLEPFKAHFDF